MKIIVFMINMALMPYVFSEAVLNMYFIVLSKDMPYSLFTELASVQSTRQPPLRRES
jgi:hypothetical protein